MDRKILISYINAENELEVNVTSLAEKYACEGADQLFIYNYAKEESIREEFFGNIREITKAVDIPVFVGIFAQRFEDIKKALYTGAAAVVLQMETIKEPVLMEAAGRFGPEKLFLEVDSQGDFKNHTIVKHFQALGAGGVFLKHTVPSPVLEENLKKAGIPIIIRDSLIRNSLLSLMELPVVQGVATNYFKNKDLMKAKLGLKEKGIPVNTFESSLDFKDFQCNNDGLVPVVTQDYKTGEVLMVAYMNQEAFDQTIKSGKMTYFSRSRQTLWCKGDTSGHVQYVKALLIDCDCDTILAKVRQIGSACHTGARTCFYRELVKREYCDANPAKVLGDVFDVIVDRKNNPKEGSYTNYLFDKGIDKILKKCGEEATEIVIAAKNPDSEELKYEIADFLYHVMVLMAEKGLDWGDVMKELAHRR